MPAGCKVRDGEVEKARQRGERAGRENIGFCRGQRFRSSGAKMDILQSEIADDICKEGALSVVTLDQGDVQVWPLFGSDDRTGKARKTASCPEICQVPRRAGYHGKQLGGISDMAEPWIAEGGRSDEIDPSRPRLEEMEMAPQPRLCFT